MASGESILRFVESAADIVIEGFTFIRDHNGRSIGRERGKREEKACYD
jgi:hypothetical protein